MKSWVNRLGCLFLVFIWLFFISLPAMAFILASQQQIQIGNDPKNHLRIFLIQEADAEGLGSEWSRPSRSQPSCIQTSVSYFMWVGDGENTFFCQCYDPQTEQLLTTYSGSCSPP